MVTRSGFSEQQRWQHEKDFDEPERSPTLRRMPYGLTARQLHVLELVVMGLSDKEIAFELGITRLTVQKHVSSILKRMRAGSRTEAGVRAVREGLID